MKAIVFSGPSIARSEVEALDGVEWRPPVSQGDVLLAVRSAPVAIVIIDGVFEGEPSVWHKEILWAMSRGIHVFGAGSMGALRAAELHRFGMRGVGEIFERYAAGSCEDDDEVAVLHGPAEMAYLPLSLAMVNARATMEKAVEHSILSAPEAEVVAWAAKSIFYQHRRWVDVLSAAENAGIDSGTLRAFADWLPHGECDLKRQDARRMLVELSEFLASDPEPMRCDFSFEWTVMWDGVASGRARRSAGRDVDAGKDVERLVLDELRLHPELYREYSLRARMKRLALQEAGRARIDADAREVREHLKNIRQSMGLYSRADLDAWIEGNDWTPARLEAALKNDKCSKKIWDELLDANDWILLEELRLGGEYAGLKQRAMEKKATMGLMPSGPGPSPPQLLVWYFESHLGRAVPEDLDEYLSELGVHERGEFYRMAASQYRYSLAQRGKSA